MSLLFAQGLLSFVGVLLSLVCLFLQFVVYMVFPILRNVPGRCIVCLIAALFIGQLLFLFVEPRDWTAPEACLVTGALMHYAFLAAFFWMNVMAIDICQTFSSEVGFLLIALKWCQLLNLHKYQKLYFAFPKHTIYYNTFIVIIF